MLKTLGWNNLEARRRDSRLNLMYNITHNVTAVSAEELGMVAADGRTKANYHIKFRAMGAVTAQLRGSFVARTIPEWSSWCSISNIVPLEIECTTGQLLAVWSVGGVVYLSSARYAVGRHSTAGKMRFCRVPTRQDKTIRHYWFVHTLYKRRGYVIIPKPHFSSREGIYELSLSPIWLVVFAVLVQSVAADHINRSCSCPTRSNQISNQSTRA